MTINEINLMISTLCNFNCEYCFQSKKKRSQNNMFLKNDELLNFLKREEIQLDKNLLIKITGGESSIFCKKPNMIDPFVGSISSPVESLYNTIKKIERYKDTTVKFTTTSNGTHMKDIIKLCEKGIFDPDSIKISWDGPNQSKIRKPKDSKLHTDGYFLDQLKILGSSRYANRIRVRTAVTRETVSDLNLIVRLLHSIGIERWEYYFIDDYPMYEDDSFIFDFETELKSILESFELNAINKNLPHDLANSYFVNFNERDNLKDQIYQCKNLDGSIAISNSGVIFPCLEHMQTNCGYIIGRLDDGFDSSVEYVYKSSKEYFDNKAKKLNLTKIRQNNHCQYCVFNEL